MKNKKYMLLSRAVAGVGSGFLNGLFGSGGGVVAVMFLRKIIGDDKKAHASATLIILIMSIVSLVLYAIYGHIDWGYSWQFVPGGLVGAIIGSVFLNRIKTNKLRKLFAAVMIISGVVMLFI